MQFSIESIDKVCGSLLSRVSINDFPGDELFFQKPDWLQFIQDIQLAKHFVSERIPIFTDRIRIFDNDINQNICSNSMEHHNIINP